MHAGSATSVDVSASASASFVAVAVAVLRLRDMSLPRLLFMMNSALLRALPTGNTHRNRANLYVPHHAYYNIMHAPRRRMRNDTFPAAPAAGGPLIGRLQAPVVALRRWAPCLPLQKEACATERGLARARN